MDNLEMARAWTETVMRVLLTRQVLFLDPLDFDLDIFFDMPLVAVSINMSSWLTAFLS